MSRTQPHSIGLTGSIGMGKSTVAGFFAELGVPVWNADDTVHRIYAKDGAGTAKVAKLVPDAVTNEGVDRAALSRAIKEDPGLLGKIEDIVHPLVRADRAAFKSSTDAKIILFDIPLLFETGSEGEFDTLITVSAPAETQRARVLARPGMTPEKLAFILSRQMPDAEKRKRSDYVIDTGTSFEDTKEQVRLIHEELLRR